MPIIREIRDIMEPLISKMYFVNNVPERELSVAVYQILCAIQTSGDLAAACASPNRTIIDDVVNYLRALPDRNVSLPALAVLASRSPD